MRKWIDLFESAPRTLYHGTLRELLPEIEQHGLVPTVGEFVTHFYDPSFDDEYDAERDALDPLVFAASKRDLRRCVNAIIHRLRSKRIPATNENVIRYGAIIAYRDTHDDFYQRNDDANPYDEHPIQVEPGDFYSSETILPTYVVTGKRLRDLLRRNRVEGFVSQLKESLDTELPWEWHQRYWDQAAANFTTPSGTQVIVTLKGRKTVLVNFEVDGKSTLTGGGNAPAILGTVVSIIRDFVENNLHVRELSFAANVHETSRVKLYRRMCQTLLPELSQFNYRETDEDETVQECSDLQGRTHYQEWTKIYRMTVFFPNAAAAVAFKLAESDNPNIVFVNEK